MKQSFLARCTVGAVVLVAIWTPPLDCDAKPVIPSRAECRKEAADRGLMGNNLMVAVHECLSHPHIAASELGPARVTTSQELQAIVGEVGKGLKDADSAKFSDVRIKEKIGSPQEKYICGKVNAKNEFGAYVGFKYFFAVSDPAAGLVVVSGDTDAPFTEGGCKAIGL